MHEQSSAKFFVPGYQPMSLSKDIRKELVRKSLHLLIACTPTIAGVFGVFNTVLILGLGVALYSSAEYLRLSGKRIPFISRITELSMRDRDQHQFVLGPVTLGIGAMIALLLYPEPAASIGIYALAFGDGLSSIGGKLFGTVKIPFSGGKSFEGSMTCFIAVLLAIIFLVPGVSPRQALIIALASTVLEALPSKDFDNVLLPVGSGAVAMLVLQYHI